MTDDELNKKLDAIRDEVCAAGVAIIIAIIFATVIILNAVIYNSHSQ